ncbi:MAG: hypothetical protein VX027_03110 [Bacteroidota bacterium]|nr:hypothetical protein [Bacteroidota bacterium]
MKTTVHNEDFTNVPLPKGISTISLMGSCEHDSPLLNEKVSPSSVPAS